MASNTSRFTVITLFLLASAVWLSAPAVAESVWVTNDVTVNVLSRPSTSARIIQKVQSGDELEVVQKSGRFTLVQVALPDGENKRGWVLSDLLKDTPPPAIALTLAEEKAAALLERNQQLAMEQQALADEIVDVRSDYQAKQTAFETLQGQYTELRQTADNAVTLAENNQKLRTNAKKTQTRMQAMEQENASLRDQQLLYWALAGAGVLLVGLLLGLLLPKLSGKKDDRWV